MNLMEATFPPLLHLLPWKFRPIRLPEPEGIPKLEPMGNYTTPSPDSTKLSAPLDVARYGRIRTSDHRHYSSDRHRAINRLPLSPPPPFRLIGQALSKITACGIVENRRLSVMRADLKAVGPLCRRVPIFLAFLLSSFSSAVNLSHCNLP